MEKVNYFDKSFYIFEGQDDKHSWWLVRPVSSNFLVFEKRESSIFG